MQRQPPLTAWISDKAHTNEAQFISIINCLFSASLRDDKWKTSRTYRTRMTVPFPCSLFRFSRLKRRQDVFQLPRNAAEPNQIWAWESLQVFPSFFGPFSWGQALQTQTLRRNGSPPPRVSALLRPCVSPTNEENAGKTPQRLRLKQPAAANQHFQLWIGATFTCPVMLKQWSACKRISVGIPANPSASRAFQHMKRRFSVFEKLTSFGWKLPLCCHVR